jgi:hypothetical protein
VWFRNRISFQVINYIRLDRGKDAMGGALRPIDEPSKYVKAAAEPLNGW